MNVYTVTLEVKLTIRAVRADDAMVEAMAIARPLDKLQSVRPLAVAEYDAEPSWTADK